MKLWLIYDEGAIRTQAPRRLITKLSRCRRSLRQPLLYVSFHDNVENFFAVRDRLIGDFWIVLEMRYARTHRFFQRLNKFFELLIESVRVWCCFYNFPQ